MKKASEEAIHAYESLEVKLDAYRSFIMSRLLQLCQKRQIVLACFLVLQRRRSINVFSSYVVEDFSDVIVCHRSLL